MRHVIPLVFVAAIVLVGCRSASSADSKAASLTVTAPPLFQPLLITNFCTQTSSDGTWQIGVSANAVEISRFAGLTGEGFPGRSKANPDGVTIPWAAQTGWFAYVENTNRVWAYDGHHDLLLETCSDASWNKKNWISGGWESYFGHYPCAVPAEVFSRLSKESQKQIKKPE